MSQETEKKVAFMGPLEAIAIADGLLTLANRIGKWLEERREIGELTPEEEAALDAHLEATFAKWQKK
jgi:hypothetical protein